MRSAVPTRAIILGGALLVLLAACGLVVTKPITVPTFRNEAVPIASTTRGLPSDLNGEWIVSASLADSYFYDVAPVGGGVTVGVDAAGNGRWAFRDPSGTTLSVPVWAPLTGRYRQGVPGDASSTQGSPLEGTAREFWVLWVDDDFRTAVVGTPDGTFGWIMDRPGAASPDRTEAARRMLEFNGYDLSRLGGA
jgi:apolipoprotein D and lipocalin family protein